MSDLSSDSDAAKRESSNKLASISYSSSDVEEVEEEAMSRGNGRTRSIHGVGPNKMEPYSEEPLADEVWLRGYHKCRERQREEFGNLQRWLNKEIPTSEWCVVCSSVAGTNLKNCLPMIKLVVYNRGSSP